MTSLHGGKITKNTTTDIITRPISPTSSSYSYKVALNDVIFDPVELFVQSF